MSGCTLDFSYRLARKDHRTPCSYCVQPIIKGDRYAAWGWAEGGSVTAIKMHEECWDHFKESGDEYFSPGEHSRPVKERMG